MSGHHILDRGHHILDAPQEAPALVVRARPVSPARPGGVPRLAVLLGLVAFLGGAVQVARTRPSGSAAALAGPPSPPRASSPARTWNPAPPLAPVLPLEEDVPTRQPPELSARSAQAPARR